MIKETDNVRFVDEWINIWTLSITGIKYNSQAYYLIFTVKLLLDS